MLYPMKIGFHLPISKGFHTTLREAQRLGCEVVQIFVKNPRSWQQKQWKEEELEEFLALKSAVQVYAHLSYLPNIARADEEPRNREGFLHEAALASVLGVEYMVVHCGSRAAQDKGVEVAARTIDLVLERYDISILLENASGQGNTLGRDIPALGRIYEAVGRKEKVFLCLDTAHLFQSGYDIRKGETWARIVREIDRCLDGRVRFFHLNDSKTPLGSNSDRHWHIGQGNIGQEAFRLLFGVQKFAHLEGVMETPKVGNMDDENMRVMRSLSSPLVPGPFS
jgi:apurinic endonuclease APN1